MVCEEKLTCLYKDAAQLSRVQRSSVGCSAAQRVQRSSVGRALACCKAGPSSNLGSAPQGGSAH
jgi:hypothetical protein